MSTSAPRAPVVALKTVRSNLLLAAIPQAEQQLLSAELAVVNIELRDQIYDVDTAITAIYFPLTCVFSVVAGVEDDPDAAVEINTIGLEGMAGLPVFLGFATSPHRCFCQVPGQALRLDTAAFRRLVLGESTSDRADIAAGGTTSPGTTSPGTGMAVSPQAHTGDGLDGLHGLLHRYTHAVLSFVGQNVVCNRLHPAEQRTARWLAHTHDRVSADSFVITQEFLALMIGVRRATVSINARILQRAGLIHYSRGHMTVLDPAGLRAAACDCYPTIRHVFDQLK